MKTLMAAVVVSALALGGIAAGQAPPVETPRPATPKKMTMEDLGKILEGLGLEPKPYKNADGVVTGYAVVYTRGQDRLTLSVSLSPSGTNVWLQAGMLQFNEKEPATANVLLALLAKHNEMWPAYADHLHGQVHHLPGGLPEGQEGRNENPNADPAPLSERRRAAENQVTRNAGPLARRSRFLYGRVQGSVAQR
jgi:hypothetical protein